MSYKATPSATHVMLQGDTKRNTCHMSHVISQISDITYRKPHETAHMSYVRYQISHTIGDTKTCRAGHDARHVATLN